MKLSLALTLIVIATANLPAPAVSASSPHCKAWLVQSIPTDMPSSAASPASSPPVSASPSPSSAATIAFRLSSAVQFADVLQWLAGNSTKKLDVIAQYWQLNARPDDPRSGDYGYSRSDMLQFGADLGRGVYKAIEDAADRNVTIRSPLPRSVEVPHVAGYPVLSHPHMFRLPLDTPGCNHTSSQSQLSYLSFAPPELSFGKVQADEQAWVDTIKSVGSGATVRISTMDWLGQSQYADQTVYWSSISSAVSEVVFSKHAKVKILVAHWAHFINNTDVYLNSLLYSNVLCSSSKYNKCSGKVEIKYYKVPGFNMTGAAIRKGTSTGNMYPGYTRVNHGKYAVSDVRAHVGTSNLIWDYFYTTAGVGFGTYDQDIVSQLQEVFDADWDSPYAVPVEESEEGHSFSS
ncbi:hypothetical protein NL676_034272 [Syzygium grande]|nr:hypothetical protein NL676_034272 [Syzygium grande]